MDEPVGVVLVSGDSAWARAVSDALRRRGIERLALANADTLDDAIDGKAAVCIDGRLQGPTAASVARAVRGCLARIVLLRAETVTPDVTLAELAHWNDTRLPDDEELARLLAGREPAVTASQRAPELCRALVGSSEAIMEVRAMLERVAPTDTVVLITGESGTGKEVLARNIHFRSSRRPAALVALNCAAVPAELLESEIFGHEKGAFAGATDARVGCFERAEGGTLFLDEVGAASPQVQVKLLRALRERVYQRAGSTVQRACDVRIIASSHTDLAQAVAEGSFREDLYFRLNVFPIRMPPLRERRADIPQLCRELAARQQATTGRLVAFDSSALQLLQRHEWPGNVRELANLIERLSILYAGVEIDVERLSQHFAPRTAAGKDLAQAVQLPSGRVDFRGFVRDIERRLIERALREANGVTAHAATLLNLRRTTLMHKMKTLQPEVHACAALARRRRVS